MLYIRPTLKQGSSLTLRCTLHLIASSCATVILESFAWQRLPFGGPPSVLELLGNFVLHTPVSCLMVGYSGARTYKQHANTIFWHPRGSQALQFQLQ